MEDEPFVFTPTRKGPWVVEYVERLFRRREDETEASPEARKYTLWERLVWDSPLGSVIMLLALCGLITVALGVLGLFLGLISIGLVWLWEIVLDLLSLVGTALEFLYALLVSLLDRA